MTSNGSSVVLKKMTRMHDSITKLCLDGFLLIVSTVSGRAWPAEVPPHAGSRLSAGAPGLRNLVHTASSSGLNVPKL